jgi:TonB family protein
MRDKLLIYAIAISLVVHLGAVCIVGRTSASRLGPVDVSKPRQFVNVDMFEQKKPEAAATTSHSAPPPPPRTTEPVRAPHNLDTNPPPPPRATSTARVGGLTRPATAGPTRLAGNPGSGLNQGTLSSNGDVGVPRGGNGETGTVPGRGTSSGTGPGEGPGRGSQEPTPNAVEGPGRSPAPAPPAPRTVEVRVCSESGLLPGDYCKRTHVKTFIDGDQPTHKCSTCKPEPPPSSPRLADSERPVRIGGPREPRVPSSLDEGLSLSATAEWYVDTDGSVSGIHVSRSSGNSDVDRSVVNWISQGKYRPAVQDGVPRRVRMTQSFSFKT